MKANDFYSTHMVEYKPDEVFQSIGYTTIKVLEFLQGKSWDDVALAYVHALRPSSIRVTEGTVKLDARPWRVTVFVDENNIINKITQEVKVGLPEGTNSGESLDIALKYGMDSPQAEWYMDESIEGFIYSDKLYKKCKDGLIPFPKP